MGHIKADKPLQPYLPLHWQGEVWSNGKSFWLRAWNHRHNGYSIAVAAVYEDARQALVNDIASGNVRIVPQALRLTA